MVTDTRRLPPPDTKYRTCTALRVSRLEVESNGATDEHGLHLGLLAEEDYHSRCRAREGTQWLKSHGYGRNAQPKGRKKRSEVERNPAAGTSPWVPDPTVSDVALAASPSFASDTGKAFVLKHRVKGVKYALTLD